MAPLMEELTDVSLSSHEGFTDRKRSVAPLHITGRTKHVSFGPFVAIQEILSRKNFTPQELKATWYDLDEVSCMRGIARTEAKLLESGHLTGSREVSIRGLEQRTKKGSKEKKEVRMNSYAAVFLELDYQKAEGFIDDEALAEAYFTYSMPCATTAQQTGRRDEIEARRTWRSPTHRHQKEHMRGQQRQRKTHKNLRRSIRVA